MQMHRILAVLALVALCGSAMACTITGMDVVKVRPMLLWQQWWQRCVCGCDSLEQA
jgi:hypothetical protein